MDALLFDRDVLAAERFQTPNFASAICQWTEHLHILAVVRVWAIDSQRIRVRAVDDGLVFAPIELRAIDDTMTIIRR